MAVGHRPVVAWMVDEILEVRGMDPAVKEVEDGRYIRLLVLEILALVLKVHIECHIRLVEGWRCTFEVVLGSYVWTTQQRRQVWNQKGQRALVGDKQVAEEIHVLVVPTQFAVGKKRVQRSKSEGQTVVEFADNAGRQVMEQRPVTHRDSTLLRCSTPHGLTAMIAVIAVEPQNGLEVVRSSSLASAASLEGT
jgi:hypothetical protein